jgi:hypothetical protein
MREPLARGFARRVGVDSETVQSVFEDVVAAYGTRIMTSVERLVVTLKIRQGTQERAAKLIAAGPPFDPGDLGLTRHAVYLGNEVAIFAFEGENVEERVRVVINDPVRSASFAAWVPLLAGRPALAH